MKRKSLTLGLVAALFAGGVATAAPIQAASIVPLSGGCPAWVQTRTPQNNPVSTDIRLQRDCVSGIRIRAVISGYNPMGGVAPFLGEWRQGVNQVSTATRPSTTPFHSASHHSW